MHLTAKFNLAILAAFGVGLLVAVIVLDLVAAKLARHQVLENARTTFKNIQAAFAGYTYREPALNPTNLIDRAQDWEADIIRLFRDEPTRPELVLERDTPIGLTLNLARPISIHDDACLTCHGTPSAAPAALTQTYGTVNGFGWKLNETIGAQIVSVPMAVPLKLARRLYITSLIALVGIFAVVFVVINLLLHHLVIAPVKRVSANRRGSQLGRGARGALCQAWQR